MHSLDSGDRRLTFRFRAAGLLLLLAHLTVVGWLTLRPRSVPWVPAANLRPLATIRAVIAQGPWETATALGPALLLLAPLGVLLPMATGRLALRGLGSPTHTVFTGFMVSLAIELLQTDVPGRTLDVDVLLLNTAGVAAAYLLFVPPLRGLVLIRRGPRTRRAAPLPRDEGAQGPTPTIHRVGIAP
ncbi:VanZ family protein [Streptomyces sp. NPDC048639]|uniref:VanZ family protein n=1 Tax=Streptomyces sp. NPDC048639 TaxID=3365581 RepID=UPI003723C3FE